MSAAEDLFDPAASAALERRVAALAPDAAARWGKMTAAQMLAHCQVPLEVALGLRVLERSLIGLLFGRLAKRRLLAAGPFARNLPTAPAFRVADSRDFVTERRRLLELIERFTSSGPAAFADKPHPFFGPLTAAEWSALQWKHLDHHLRQFGG